MPDRSPFVAPEPGSREADLIFALRNSLHHLSGFELITRRPAFDVSTTDVLVVTALCFGVFILGSSQAVASGFPTPPFTDAMFFNIITYEIFVAAAALGYLHLRGHDLRHLVPSPTYAGSIAGAVLF